MAGGPAGLFDACRELLESCQRGMNGAPAGQIDRCYVSPNAPAWDIAPQLTVHAGPPIFTADTLPLQPPLAPGHRVAVAGTVWLAQLTVTVLRKVPVTGSTSRAAPSISALEAAAAAVYGDVWTLWNHIATEKRVGVLFAAEDGSATTREMFFDPALGINAEGGVVGFQLAFRVAMPGFRTQQAAS